MYNDVQSRQINAHTMWFEVGRGYGDEYSISVKMYIQLYRFYYAASAILITILSA